MISEFPLLVFTVLTGIAAGGYIAAAVFPKKSEDARPWLFPLVALILVGAGGLAAVGHLGRPANMLNMLNNPTASLVLEGIFSGVLAVVAIVDLALGFSKKQAVRAVRIVGAVAGLALLCFVTYAYVTSYGNAAWISMPTYLVFVVGGLAAGFACWMLFVGAGNTPLGMVAAVIAAAWACVLAWQAVTFSDLGAAGVGAIAAGAVLALATAVAEFLASRGKCPATVATALAVVALVVSRYGFYMASII